ncbi:extracellular solute-binding protein, partial [Paraburkholderia sp. SIMBA_049]
DQFHKANPDIDLKVSYVGEEAYKVQMSGWLATDPPDVLSWNNGERLAYFAKRGLIEDLSADWQKNGWNDTYAAVKQSSTYGGKLYSLP